MGARWFAVTESLMFLLKKDLKYWSWEEDCEQAWQELRARVLATPAPEVNGRWLHPFVCVQCHARAQGVPAEALPMTHL